MYSSLLHTVEATYGMNQSIYRVLDTVFTARLVSFAAPFTRCENQPFKFSTSVRECVVQRVVCGVTAHYSLTPTKRDAHNLECFEISQPFVSRLQTEPAPSCYV